MNQTHAPLGYSLPRGQGAYGNALKTYSAGGALCQSPQNRPTRRASPHSAAEPAPIQEPPTARSSSRSPGLGRYIARHRLGIRSWNVAVRGEPVRGGRAL